MRAHDVNPIRKRTGILVLLLGAALGLGLATIDNWRGGRPLPADMESPVAP